MKPDLLEVQPQELKFIFEVKKQSSCSVEMINKTSHYVAFKIKTTNPKKYCVRPNAGVIDPGALCDFSVTMQAPKVAPPDMICRDKFLVQSTIVSEGTKEEDVTSSMFAKEGSKIVDEKKLRVTFISPPESSPLLDLVDSNESRELKDDIAQQSSSHAMGVKSMEVPKGDAESVEVTQKEESIRRKEAVKRIEEPLKPSNSHGIRNEELLHVKRIEEPIKPSHGHGKGNEELMQIKDTEELTLAKDVEEMKSKLKELESKLTEAKATILHLTEEKRSVAQEKHFLQGELDLVRSKRHRGQAGFPLLFVFMVGLVSLYLGYLLHS